MSADPTGLVARLRKLDCCAVSDALDQFGLDSGVVTGLLQQGSGASRIAGRAITDRSAVIFVAAVDIERVLAASERIVAKEEAMAKDILAGTPIGTVMGASYEHMLK